MDSTTIADIARSPRLLVITDFDGTIAGLTADAYNVPVNLSSLAALTRLAGMPNTPVAILSGRHLEGLARVCDLRPPIVRAGSHGNESSLSPAPTASQRELLKEVERQLRPLVEAAPGSFIEQKPFQRVVHTAALKRKDPEKAAEVLRQAAALEIEGAHAMLGKSVVEFSVTNVTKGTWIQQMREHMNPDATIFVGDDATDEEGFKVLEAGDLSVKVGVGDSAAVARLSGTEEVGEFFTALADERASFLDVPRTTFERFEWAAAGLGAVVHQVTDWDATTPCAGWTARHVIRHLNTWVASELKLEPVLGEDPVDEYFTFVDAMRSLLEEEDSRTERLIGKRLITDLFIHTWDLAQAAGVDPKLDEEFAARLLAAFEKLDPQELVDSGRFAPAVEVPEDASALDRLLAITGRTPAA